MSCLLMPLGKLVIALQTKRLKMVTHVEIPAVITLKEREMMPKTIGINVQLLLLHVAVVKVLRRMEHVLQIELSAWMITNLHLPITTLTAVMVQNAS